MCLVQERTRASLPDQWPTYGIGSDAEHVEIREETSVQIMSVLREGIVVARIPLVQDDAMVERLMKIVDGLHTTTADDIEGTVRSILGQCLPSPDAEFE